MLRRSRRILSALLLLASCRGDAPGASAGAETGAHTDAGAGAGADAGSAPRRPKRRHYFARKSDRCEIYTIEGESPQAATEVPCPSEAFLAEGERIRLAGKTCMREPAPSSTDPSRQVPVICPSPLIGLDRDALEARDAGSP